MIHKIFILFILIFLLIGCQSAPQITLVTPLNEPAPDPHYVLADVGNVIRVVFYYEAIALVKDLDHTLQTDKVYLDKNIDHVLSSERYENVQLVMKVYNPKEIEYEIWGILSADFSDDTKKGHRWMAAKSDRVFRTHYFPTSLNKEIKSISFSFEIRSDNTATLMRTGTFNYVIY